MFICPFVCLCVCLDVCLDVCLSAVLTSIKAGYIKSFIYILLIFSLFSLPLNPTKNHEVGSRYIKISSCARREIPTSVLWIYKSIEKLNHGSRQQYFKSIAIRDQDFQIKLVGIYGRSVLFHFVPVNINLCSRGTFVLYLVSVLTIVLNNSTEGFKQFVILTDAIFDVSRNFRTLPGFGTDHSTK